MAKKVSKAAAKPAAKAGTKPAAKSATKSAVKTDKSKVAKKGTPLVSKGKSVAKAASKAAPPKAVGQMPASKSASSKAVPAKAAASKGVAAKVVAAKGLPETTQPERTLQLTSAVVQVKTESVKLSVVKAEAKGTAETPAKPAKAPRVSKSKADKAGSGDDVAKWVEYHERYKSQRAAAYDMKASYEAGTPLQHKVLGWGWILSSENNRLEVLFEDGKRMLISNYNPGR